MLCLYLIFKPPKDGLFAMPFISWLSSTYLFQTLYYENSEERITLLAKNTKEIVTDLNINRRTLFMIEYSYKDIQKITKAGILFIDGFEFLFEECKNEWSVQNNIKGGQSCCVAERYSFTKIPYFLFFSKKRVKVLFDKKGIFGKKRNKNDFQNLQVVLNRFGFSSYDMT